MEKFKESFKHLKKDPIMKYMVFYLIEFYFRKLSMSLSKNINIKYSYFLRRISDTKTFVNAPPNDIMVSRERIRLTVNEDENVTMSTYTQKKFVEVKVVLYKGKDTEIIIRQDF